MRYLHSQGILHRDLKPQNVLMDENYYPRVCDFGLSKCFSYGLTPTIQISMTANIGTPLYMAPELFDFDDDDDDDENEKNHHRYSTGIDVYAYAILMYEIVTDKIPFFKNGKAPTWMKLAKKVSNGIRPEIPDSVPQKMKDLLGRCWAEEPKERPSFGEIFDLLSSDFSYINEKVDEKEVKEYIDALKESRNTETKGSQASQQNQQKQPLEQEEEIRPLSDLIVNESSIELHEEIGQGPLSYVYRATLPQGECAVSVTHRDTITSLEDSKYIMNEIEMHSKLKHEAILQFVGFTLPSEKNDKYKLISQYMPNGSLFKLIEDVSKGNAPDDWDTIKAINIFGIAAGMAYMHQNRIAHRNLKPENIMLDEDYHPKITDFALAEYFKKGGELSKGDIGTPLYMSPETFDEEGPVTYKVDVYSYSMVLYSLLIGSKPFYNVRSLNLFSLVKMLQRGERPIIREHEMPSIYIDLLQKCWNSDPDERPSFTQIVKMFIDQKEEFFDFPLIDEELFEDYIYDAIEGLDLN